jgi:tetratricopeptide (TPR) repeat protein/O-antigen ligase
MSTKLSRYAEGVMEATWLAVIVMAPLFFNKYSSRIFEPDKATLLRSLALIILLAWCVKLFDQSVVSKRRIFERFSIKDLLKTPVVVPVILLTLVFILATIFSVTSRISFWGSYQRLQGMYTTLAYLVLFSSLIGNLRERSQIERMITTAVLTSLPISLYGVLQHFGIDPIPWGGDVTRRVASHMGNPIFVAAFLIMVFPLTVGRIVDSFGKILWETEGVAYQTIRSTIYIFIAALQLIAIYFTKSRGPLLGLLAGAFFIFILLALHWRLRWLIAIVTILGIVVGGFLLALNIPNGPLESIREAPWMGRLGRMLDMTQRTSQVRILIWQGAAEMVAPHEALEFPDGHLDPFNFLRPLIGYGPETMHMAYNPFYPPELAHIEKRNASPDRSHNETWDSLVITGVLGLLTYLLLFGVVFYYGFKWLGLIVSVRQKILFMSLYIGGGIISAIGFYLWQGIEFFGVALPFGSIIGLIGYLTLVAVFKKQSSKNGTFTPSRSIILIVLLSGIMAHFVEINFGISIVSTRTYFFLYTGLIVAVGFQFPKLGEYHQIETEAEVKEQKKKFSRKRKSKFRGSSNDSAGWRREIFMRSIVVGLLIIPMNFEYIANLRGLTSATQILWTSFTQLEENVISYGVLALILTTWLSSSVILASEIPQKHLASKWWKSFGAILGISISIALFYGFWLSGSLAKIARMAPQNINEVLIQTASLESLLTQFFAFTTLSILILGFYLPSHWPIRTRNESFWTPILAVIGFIFVIWLSITTNLRIIHADMAFKMAEPFANSRQWAVANVLYRRSIELSPDEDYYYLFLGRGSLENAKTITDPIEQEQAFRTAEADLLRAQLINPLNPDHTANLGRLYSWWALQAPDENARHERGEISDEYYSRVIILSPNNARLWDEWAILQLNVLDDPERAFELLSHSLEIDPMYDWTHALMGDYFNSVAMDTEAQTAQKDLYTQAVYHYKKAIEIYPKNTNYYFALASAYQSMNDIPGVIDTLEKSLEVAGNSEIWKIEDNLAHYYLQVNDIESALIHAQKALIAAPETEHERLQTVINQLSASP